jgi:Bacteriophage Mu Gp45 spike protein
MHRATPIASSHRGYVSGGSRSVVTEVDDSKLMQEMKGSIQHSEQRGEIEAPQNYGFTSVVFDADKDAQGNITDGAEASMSFMGGNRSFPVAGVMDDRRHRLYGMEKGDTAMFRGKDDQQQFHLTKDGGFWSAPIGKTLRMALVPEKKKQQQGQAKEVGALVSSGGGTDTGQGQQQQQKERGQKPLKDDNKGSKYFVEINGEKVARMAGKDVKLLLDDGKTYIHIKSDKKVYLGGSPDEGGVFALVETVAGPSINVLARIG